MLAICSDLDETPDAKAYFELMRFLNTREMTSMGEGVGLEVGNSIYFDMPSDQFAYWNTDDGGREMVRTLIKRGHIDCLHSYGDLATTRAHAARALEELARHSLSLKVWIDHAVAPTNFGADIMCGHGDEQGHPAYHADLTIRHGVRYVWRGRVTSVIGQDCPVSLAGIATAQHSITSTRTFLKEAAKQVLARCGVGKYMLHGSNASLTPATLRDGSAVSEFLRCNPHWGGVSCCDTGRGIGQVLTESFLERLVHRQGVCLLYTHLGKLAPGGESRRFSDAAIAAFRRLARYFEDGKILVTTTRRLLDYVMAFRDYDCVASSSNELTHLNVCSGSSNFSVSGLAPVEVQGLTAYVPDVAHPAPILGNAAKLAWVQNPADHTGRKSISIPWQRLEFPRF